MSVYLQAYRETKPRARQLRAAPQNNTHSPSSSSSSPSSRFSSSLSHKLYSIFHEMNQVYLQVYGKTKLKARQLRAVPLNKTHSFSSSSSSFSSSSSHYGLTLIPRKIVSAYLQAYRETKPRARQLRAAPQNNTHSPSSSSPSSSSLNHKLYSI